MTARAQGHTASARSGREEIAETVCTCACMPFKATGGSHLVDLTGSESRALSTVLHINRLLGDNAQGRHGGPSVKRHVAPMAKGRVCLGIVVLRSSMQRTRGMLCEIRCKLLTRRTLIALHAVLASLFGARGRSLETRTYNPKGSQVPAAYNTWHGC
jgi:hypothetical protein